MKKTLFITMLAAALMGGQVFADYIPTATDADKVDDGFYVGKYSETGDVSRANVTINEEEEGGEDFSQSGVYGGFTGGEQTSAINNSVTMTGGQVDRVEGGYCENGIAMNNTVSVSGGQVGESVYGGHSFDGNANNNIVTISGGQVNEVRGGYSFNGNVANNSVTISGGQVDGYMYGGLGDKSANGNTVTIKGGKVNNEVYGAWSAEVANGNTVSILGGQVSENVFGASSNGTANGNTVVLSSCVVGGYVVAADASGTSTDNAIEIYGTGSTCWGMDCMQLLNFHIADGVLLSQKALVSLTGTGSYDALNLKGVELGLYGDDVKDWSAFDGKSITLVSAKKAIKNATGSLGDVEIKGKDGELLATASLGLANSSKSLVLSNIKGVTPVPEPTTGVLGLLALGLLAGRRRKH